MSDTMSFDAAAYTASGTSRERVSLPPALFDGTVNMPVMHRAVKAFLTNQREGNASTKTRGLVVGGNQKPWKQKGTGRARQGSTRAPNWPGGGTVFGPLPKSYDEQLPGKMKALARKSAFNARARENAIFVIDTFGWSAPSTRTMAGLLARIGVAEQKVLVLTDGVKRNVYLSGRNLGNVQVMPYSDVSTYHILWSDAVLVEASAVGHALSPVAEKAYVAPKKAPAVAAAPEAPRKSAAKKAAAKPVIAKAVVTKKAAPKAAAKPASRPAAKKAAPKKKGK